MLYQRTNGSNFRTDYGADWRHKLSTNFEGVWHVMFIELGVSRQYDDLFDYEEAFRLLFRQPPLRYSLISVTLWSLILLSQIWWSRLGVHGVSGALKRWFKSARARSANIKMSRCAGVLIPLDLPPPPWSKSNTKIITDRLFQHNFFPLTMVSQVFSLNTIVEIYHKQTLLWHF